MTWAIEQTLYAGFPSNEFHNYAAYHQWVRDNSPGKPWTPTGPRMDPKTLKVVIVGAGHAGLYSAMLLLKYGVPGKNITILEASKDRVGGRVWTYRFPNKVNDKDQYSDLGAMRLPITKGNSHKIVFDLIDYFGLAKMKYHYTDPNNRISVNGVPWMKKTVAEQYPGRLKFPHGVNFNPLTRKYVPASKFFADSLVEFMAITDPQKRFDAIVSYDKWSFRQYLSLQLRWSAEKINYVQTMTSASGQFDKALPEVVFESLDFAGENTWQTLTGGMGKLTDAIVAELKKKGVTITTDRRVTKLADTSATEVKVTATYKVKEGGHDKEKTQEYTAHKVILAVPFAPIRMMDTPKWPVAKNAAIRDLGYESLYKCAIPFHQRWWKTKLKDGSTVTPIAGGQSQTDLAAWWQVYASDPDQATMLIYAWATDADMLATLSEDDRAKEIYRAIHRLHPEVEMRDAQFYKAKDVFWSHTYAGGNAHFLPGQYTAWYHIATEPEGNISFAGEHLSFHHGWISGAYESALMAVGHVLDRDDLEPIRKAGITEEPHLYDYSSIGPAADDLPEPRATEEEVPASALR